MIIVSKVIDDTTKTKLEAAGHIVVVADPHEVATHHSDPYFPSKQEPDAN